MLICCEVGLEYHSYIPPRNISIYSLSMTINTHNCGEICRPSSLWLLLWNWLIWLPRICFDLTLICLPRIFWILYCSTRNLFCAFSSCFCLPLALKKFWVITLWGSNKLCAYYKPRKCEHVRYCHLELIFFIILFLCGMLLKQVPFLVKWFWLINLLDLVCDGHSWYGFLQICLHISCWETDCFKLLFVVALHDRVNIWSYQEYLFI